MKELAAEAKLLLSGKQLCRDCYYLLIINHHNGSFSSKCKYQIFEDYGFKEYSDVNSNGACNCGAWKFKYRENWNECFN
jgi:hypothetical protein